MQFHTHPAAWLSAPSTGPPARPDWGSGVLQIWPVSGSTNIKGMYCMKVLVRAVRKPGSTVQLGQPEQKKDKAFGQEDEGASAIACNPQTQ